MSFIGDLFSSDNGAGYNALANSGVTDGQLSVANDNVARGLGIQDQFLQALAAQNGLQNQSQVYNQLQGVVNGTGPNPAAAMLNQATANNTANQAALMAGQRGSSANAGLIARQAAMQGAANQQNAIGQAATMQANQSLNALNAAGSLANQQVSNQQQGIGQYAAQAQAAQNALLNARTGANQTQAGIAQGNQKSQAGVIGGVLNGVGALFANGGEVPAPAESKSGPTSAWGKFMAGVGQPMAPSAQANPLQDEYAAGSQMGQGAVQIGKGLGKKLGGLFSTQGQVLAGDPVSAPGAVDPAMMMQDPAALQGMATALVANGGMIPSVLEKQNKKAAAKPMKSGGKVPGKARMKGDSIKNDTVPAMLSPGEVVIPKSVMESDDPVKGAAAFVQALLAKQGGLKR